MKADDESLIKIEFMELLIADELFFFKFQPDDCARLKAVMLKKYTEKTQAPELYGLFNVQKTLLLGAMIEEKNIDVKTSKSGKEHLDTFIREFDATPLQTIENVSKIICE